MTLFALQDNSVPVQWEPTAAAAQDRLSLFLPNSGRAYAATRNFDYGPEFRDNISALSPWIRHRLIREIDVLRPALAAHGFRSSEKFVQEVLWRGYFKGWLEHRPEVWKRYRRNLTTLVDQLETDASLARRYEDAIVGRTGIICFDSWVQELIVTGYLHNHARMWFASIWIFTLELPWELGADFFYRHLLDGDPASNTCSWRWVGGLHTAGKTYQAKASNIFNFTEGRFNPMGQLAETVTPLSEPDLPSPVVPMFDNAPMPDGRIGLIITEEDCSPETLPISSVAILGFTGPSARSVLPMGEMPSTFAAGAVMDAVRRGGAHFDIPTYLSDTAEWGKAMIDWARDNEIDALVTARASIGPVAPKLSHARQLTEKAGLPLIEHTRDYDRVIWPHATRGFFGLKKKIPHIFKALELIN